MRYIRIGLVLLAVTLGTQAASSYRSPSAGAGIVITTAGASRMQ